MNTDREKINHHVQITNEQDEKLVADIHNYEKRIQGLIEGIGMLKERVTSLIQSIHMQFLSFSGTYSSSA